MAFRIGNGYDLHCLVEGRDLILGGVKIDHAKGLLGHSDADVLTHAIMDALLGALSLGDIGHYFPPTDEKWKGADSLKLLEQVYQLVQSKGWQVVNLDTVIIAERPKMKPHIATMREKIATTMGISPELVGVKATTNEKQDSMGAEASIAVHAVVLLEQVSAQIS